MTKQERLPDEGYYLAWYGFDESCKTERPSAYYVKNGTVKYIHWDWGEDWCTLLWTCMPTRIQITNSITETGDRYMYEYFKSHQEMVNAHPELDHWFHVKAPNDKT